VSKVVRTIDREQALCYKGRRRHSGASVLRLFMVPGAAHRCGVVSSPGHKPRGTYPGARVANQQEIGCIVPIDMKYQFYRRVVEDLKLTSRIVEVLADRHLD